MEQLKKDDIVFCISPDKKYDELVGVPMKVYARMQNAPDTLHVTIERSIWLGSAQSYFLPEKILRRAELRLVLFQHKQEKNLYRLDGRTDISEIDGIRVMTAIEVDQQFRLLDQYPSAFELPADHYVKDGAELMACYAIKPIDSVPDWLPECGVGFVPYPLDLPGFEEWRDDHECGIDWAKQMTVHYVIFESNGCAVQPSHSCDFSAQGWIHDMDWDFAANGDPSWDYLTKLFQQQDQKKPVDRQQLVHGRFAVPVEWRTKDGKRYESRKPGSARFLVPLPADKQRRFYGDERDFYQEVWVHRFWLESTTDEQELIRAICPQAERVYVSWPQIIG